MATKIPGYHGQLLDIDLTAKTTKTVDLDPKLARDYHRRAGDGRQDAAGRVRDQLGEDRSPQPRGAAAGSGGPVRRISSAARRISSSSRRSRSGIVGGAGQRRLHPRTALLRLRRDHPQGEGQLARLPHDLRRQGGVPGRVEDVGQGDPGNPPDDRGRAREPDVAVLHRAGRRESGPVCGGDHRVVPGGGSRRRRRGDGLQEPQGHRLPGHRARRRRWPTRRSCSS